MFILRHGYIDVNLFIVFFILSLAIAIISKLLRINAPGVIALSTFPVFLGLVVNHLADVGLLCGKDEISVLKDLFLSVTALLGMSFFILPSVTQVPILPVTLYIYLGLAIVLLVDMFRPDLTDFVYLIFIAPVLFWSIKKRVYTPFGIALLLAVFLPLCKAPFLLLITIALDVYRFYERRRS
ncbi:MAG: hypothetical protein ACK4M3_05670 [Pyrobaculum sp.]